MSRRTWRVLSVFHSLDGTSYRGRVGQRQERSDVRQFGFADTGRNQTVLPTLKAKLYLTTILSGCRINPIDE
jgi:hypothetical protein